MLKVTNKSARLHNNVGGQSVIPGQSVEIEDHFLPDIEGNDDLEIEQMTEAEIEAEVEEKKLTKAEAKAAALVAAKAGKDWPK